MPGRTAVPKALGRPRDVESTQTRERLLAVARQAFARDGFARTTNRQLAEAAGLTAGAIYHYYPSKAELWAAVYAEVHEILQRSFARDLEKSDRFLDRLAATLDSSVVLNRMDPSITGFVVNVPYEVHQHPELEELIAPVRAARTSMAGRMVADAVANGEFADGVDPVAVRDLLNAIFSGLARFHNHVGDQARHAGAVAALKLLVEGRIVG